MRISDWSSDVCSSDLKATGSVVLDQGRAALRLSGFRSKADVIITNTADGRKLNDNDSWGVRGKLLFEPSDVTAIYVIGDYGESNRNCFVSTVRSVMPTTTFYNGETRADLPSDQIGNACCRERDGQFVQVSVMPGYI